MKVRGKTINVCDAQEASIPTGNYSACAFYISSRMLFLKGSSTFDNCSFRLSSQNTYLRDEYIGKNHVCFFDNCSFNNSIGIKSTRYDTNMLSRLRIIGVEEYVSSIDMENSYLILLSGISRFINLEKLNINGTRVVDFSPEIVKCKKLRSISTLRSQIRWIPEFLSKIESLEILTDADFNREFWQFEDCSTEQYPFINKIRRRNSL